LEGFQEGLKALGETQDAVWSTDFEDAKELGRRAATYAVAPILWGEAIGERHDTSAVAHLLGVSRQALAKRVANGSLIGVKGRGTTWFPAWQFDPVGREVRPVVARLVHAFRDVAPDTDALTIATWATTPQADLEDASPEEWILEGKDEKALLSSARETAQRLAA
jgi:hypothetical protein